VCVGQPLLDADGVMGQTIHVGPLSATAMLITDVSQANGQRIVTRLQQLGRKGKQLWSYPVAR
jgi:cell shape-determining protein MreC